MKSYLGIDIGGTAVKYGLIDSTGTILSKGCASVCFDDYKTPILETVVRAVRSFLNDQLKPESGINEAAAVTEASFDEYLLGIGVSATGQIDTATGTVIGTCGNLPGWNGTRIKERLEAEFSVPVTVANDANCMCLGEAFAGAAKGCEDVLGVTIGTGIGGGIISHGRLVEGAFGLGGEIGHFMTHAISGELCTCGQRGCFERYASTTALVRKAKAYNSCLIDGEKVFEAVIAGDEGARKLLDSWISEIVVGLSSLVHIVNPKMIVIGGGVSAQEELLVDAVREGVMSSVMPAFARNLQVKPALLGNDAGMIGAVFYFIRVSEGRVQ